MFNFDDDSIAKVLGHGVDYDFKKLLNSKDQDVRYLAVKLLTLDRALNRVVESKESYFDEALRKEDSETEALLDVFAFCQDQLNEVWNKYDKNYKRH